MFEKIATIVAQNTGKIVLPITDFSGNRRLVQDLYAKDEQDFIDKTVEFVKNAVDDGYAVNTVYMHCSEPDHTFFIGNGEKLAPGHVWGHLAIAI